MSKTPRVRVSLSKHHERDAATFEPCCIADAPEAGDPGVPLSTLGPGVLGAGKRTVPTMAPSLAASAEAMTLSKPLTKTESEIRAAAEMPWKVDRTSLDNTGNPS